MKYETIIIKNMTCDSCIRLVESELATLGIKIFSLKLGEVKILKNENKTIIQTALQKHGFDIIEGYEELIVENIRLAVIELVSMTQDIENMHFTKYLEKKVERPYKYLSKIFSKHRKTTIEHFLILNKVEKAKEFIQYGQLTFSEIAYALGYANPQHLSAQFKKNANCTMKEFKENHLRRVSLSKI